MEFDFDGFWSLIFTIFLVIIFLTIKLWQGKRPKDIITLFKESIQNFFKELDVPSALTAFTLIGAAILGLWLSVRVIGLFAIRRYLFTYNYNYNPYQILEIVSYVLAMHLCFTLFKSVTATAKGSTAEGKPSGIKQIVSAAMQAVLIGIITFLPKYGDADFMRVIGGAYGFVFILVSMAIMLVALMFVRERIKE